MDPDSYTFEIWKDIPGYEGKYQASSLGKIRSLTRKIRTVSKKRKETLRTVKGSILKNDRKINGAGYYGVSLGRKKYEMIHRLVAITFLGDKRHLEVNHKNFNKLDNRVCNLEWVTPRQNQKHSWESGRMEKARASASIRWSGNGNPKYKDGRCMH